MILAVTAFPYPTQAAIIRQTGDPTSIATMNAYMQSQTTISPSDSGTHIWASMKIFAAVRTLSGSPVYFRIKNLNTNTFLDCQTGYVNTGALPTPSSTTGGPASQGVGTVLTLDFSGSQCTSSPTGFYFVYQVTDANPTNTGAQDLWIGGNTSNGEGSIIVSDVPFPPDDTTTRIDVVEPADDEVVATSTPTTFGMEGYLNSDDYRAGARARLKLDRNTDSQAVGALIAWEAATGNYTDFPITDGVIDISTTTVEQLLGVDREGLWRMRWEIQTPRFNIFGFSLFYDTLVSTSTTYIYGDPTGIDVIQQQQEEILEGLFDTMSDPLANCQFDLSTILDFSASDNIFSCVTTMVSAMVIPNQQQAQQLIEGARSSFLEKAPWGYATRVYDIVSYSTATSTLPSIAFTLPDGLPGAEREQVIDFSPWAPIESAVDRIDNTEVETIDGSPLEMFLFWWNTMWLIVFALWVIRELHGAWEAGDFEHDGHSSSKMDHGIYAYRGLVQTRTKMDRKALRNEQRRIINRSRM